jgi:hypothetical protein
MEVFVMWKAVKIVKAYEEYLWVRVTECQSLAIRGHEM